MEPHPRRAVRPSRASRKVSKNRTTEGVFMKRVLILSTLVLVLAAAGLFGQKPPGPKSKGEAEAYNAIMTSTDPDGRIKAAEAFLTKYADSELRPPVLFVEAFSYQQKNDFEKMVIYA